mgnify:CR=1 FL=1
METEKKRIEYTNGEIVVVLHPFGRLRPHASRSLQPAGAAVGETGKRHDRPDRRAGRKMPFGSVVLS